MTTVDTDTARWSLPGPADMPTDQLQVQLEVYNETVLLRGFEGDRTWVRTVSADEIANVFTRHLGFASGCCPKTPSGGARGRPARWWHCGARPRSGRWRLQREAFQPPARLRLPMPGLVFVCSPARAPWVYAALERPTAPSSSFTAPRPSTSSETAGPAPAATASPRRWAGYPNPSSSPSSPLLEIPGTGRRSTPTTCKRYGRN